MKTILSSAAIAALLLLAGTASAQPFSYDPPGQLVPKSGEGRVDTNVYAPTMRFPMEAGPAFANSQVYGNGGNFGPGGGQCDEENYSYPWHDNYCESRSWDMPLCPGGKGHQGQDIRAATCKKLVHWIVAAEDGTITNVGSYSVYVTTKDGTRFDYLHMGEVAVKEGDKVTRGQHLGKVSNEFGGEVTTTHLHFNIRQNVEGTGMVYVPPYMSLVHAYEDLMGLSKPDAGPPPPPPPPPQQPPPAAPEPEAPTPAAEEPPADEGCGIAARTAGSASPFALISAAAVVAAVRRRRRRG